MLDRGFSQSYRAFGFSFLLAETVFLRCFLLPVRGHCVSLRFGSGQWPFAAVPGRIAGIGCLVRCRCLGPLGAQGEPGPKKIFWEGLGLSGGKSRLPAGAFSNKSVPLGTTGEKSWKKGEKTEKKDLKTLCIPGYNKKHYRNFFAWEPSR